MSLQAKKRIRVVAAQIEREGRYLITQRRPEATLPYLWEFPGGRVEPGESDSQALSRELAEILDARINVDCKVMTIQKEYESFVIDFHVYRCNLLDRSLNPVRVNDLRWVTTAELEQYEFPAADQHTVDLLLQGR